MRRSTPSRRPRNSGIGRQESWRPVLVSDSDGGLDCRTDEKVAVEAQAVVGRTATSVRIRNRTVRVWRPICASTSAMVVDTHPGPAAKEDHSGGRDGYYPEVSESPASLPTGHELGKHYPCRSAGESNHLVSLVGCRCITSDWPARNLVPTPGNTTAIEVRLPLRTDGPI